MTAPPFVPADGECARWRHLYRLVETREAGEAITYAEAIQMLDCDLAEAQASMRAAMAHLERDGKRSVRTVTRFGWVVMHAREHADRSRHHLKKSRNQAQYAGRKAIPAATTLRGELTQAERHEVDFVQLAAQLVESINTRPRSTLAQLATPRPALPIGR